MHYFKVVDEGDMSNDCSKRKTDFYDRDIGAGLNFSTPTALAAYILIYTRPLVIAPRRSHLFCGAFILNTVKSKMGMYSGSKLKVV